MDTNAGERKPLITIVMPCLDDQATIGRAVRSLLDAWTIRNAELIVVDGGSRDGTRRAVEDLVRNPPETPEASLAGVPGGPGRPEDEVIWLMQSRDRWVREVTGEWNPVTSGKRRAVVRLLDNPERTAATGMNMAIAQAAGKVIVRADARSVFPPSYVRRCVELLADSGAACAGGVRVPRGEAGTAQAAIALALRHPLGPGDPALRKPGFKGDAGSVAFGTFRRAVLDELGGYDAQARAGEDAELMVRIVCSGKRVFRDGDIRVAAFPPGSFSGLARRAFLSGQEAARTTKRRRMFTSWKQIAAPMLVAAMAFSIVRSVKAPVHLLFFAAYFASVLAAALVGPVPEDTTPPDTGTRVAVARALATLHLSWGAGFIWGLLARW
jgi:succinoglycan biosynthesis protein ExoA